MAEPTNAEKDFMANMLGGAKPEEKVIEESKPDEQANTEVIIDPSNVEAATAAAKVETENPYNKIIMEKFGYNTIEDLINSDAHEKVKRFSDIEAELNRYKAENEELVNEFGTVSNPYVNEHTAKLDNMLRKYPELSVEMASRLLNLNVSNMTALDKIVMAEKLNNPDMNDAQIRRSLERSFNVDNFDDLKDPELDDKIKLDISIFEKKAERKLSEYNFEYKPDDKYIPEKVRERINQRLESQKVNETEIERVWLPASQHLEANFKELDVMLPNSDGKYESYTKYVLSESDRKEAAQLAVQLAKAHGLKEINESTVKVINEAIYMNTFFKNRFNIMKTVADKARNDEFSRYTKERDGIKDTKTEVSDKGTGSKSLIDIINKAAPNKPFGAK